MEAAMTATAEHPPPNVADRVSPPVGPPITRLLVVDDHAAVRRGVSELLEDQPDFRVLAAVSSAEEAIAVAERKPVDVAVIDFQLEGRNGLWATRKLKGLPKAPRVLIYSAYADGVLTAAAVAAGADGVMSKGGLGSELCAGIRTVARGHPLLPPLSGRVGELLRSQLDGEQQAIFGMSLAGIASDDIARTMRISRSSLESRRSELLRKLKLLGAG